MNIFEQGLLKYLSREQLAKIQSIRIGLGGAGGLGSNCAMMLVRTGFKHFEIIDQDVIDATNLNRQQYYLNEIGLPKVAVTKNRLLAINPDLNQTVHQAKWTPETGAQYFRGCDVIIEAFDAAEWKYKFVEYYQDKASAVVSGVGMAGLLEKKPMIKRQLGNVWFVGDLNTDAACGHPPLAPRVTQCAAMMAEIVLDLTLGIIPRGLEFESAK